jgi:hypothetical protein
MSLCTKHRLRWQVAVRQQGFSDQIGKTLLAFSYLIYKNRVAWRMSELKQLSLSSIQGKGYKKEQIIKKL